RSVCLSYFSFFLLIIRPPPISTLFPYTTLFRSHKLSVFTGDCPRCHGDKRIVATAGGDGVELVLPSLEALLHLFFQVRPGHLLRSEEHTSELQSRFDLVCRLLLEKKKNTNNASN